MFTPTKRHGLCAHLDSVPESEVGRKLQVAQAHARHWAGAVALPQPALYAHAVVCVPRRHHHRIRHQLLQMHTSCSDPQSDRELLRAGMMLTALRAQASPGHQKVQLTQALPDTCQTVAGEDNTIHCCM